MPRRIYLLSAILSLAAVNLCHAGGSVDFEDVDRLIRAQPATYQWMSSTLQFPDAADAEIRFGKHFTHLGGARMGPYMFRAKVKGVAASAEVDVTVCTSAEFQDKSGKTVSKAIEKNATQLKEKLVTILVRDASDTQAAPDCPKP